MIAYKRGNPNARCRPLLQGCASSWCGASVRNFVEFARTKSTLDIKLIKGREGRCVIWGWAKNLLTFFAKSDILYKWASRYREIWTIPRYVWRIAICASPIIVGYGPHSCSMLTNEVHRSVEDEVLLASLRDFRQYFF